MRQRRAVGADVLHDSAAHGARNAGEILDSPQLVRNSVRNKPVPILSRARDDRIPFSLDALYCDLHDEPVETRVVEQYV